MSKQEAVMTQRDECWLCGGSRVRDPQRGGCGCFDAAESFMREPPRAGALDAWYRDEVRLGIAAAHRARRAERRAWRATLWGCAVIVGVVAAYFAL
jgi:hypothetical protein